MMKNIWPQPLQFTMILIRSLILSNIKFSFTFHNMSIGQIRSSLKFFFFVAHAKPARPIPRPESENPLLQSTSHWSFESPTVKLSDFENVFKLKKNTCPKFWLMKLWFSPIFVSSSSLPSLSSPSRSSSSSTLYFPYPLLECAGSDLGEVKFATI